MMQWAIAFVASTAMALPVGFEAADFEAWQSQRQQNLTQPGGWLALIGLHWLEPGKQRIGSDANAGVHLAAGLAHWGELNFDPKLKRVLFEQVADGVLVDGKPGKRFELRSDQDAAPSLVQAGSVSFTVIVRSGRFGLRVRDSEAVTRKNFRGLDYFAFDPNWVVKARFERFAKPTLLEVGTMIGTVERTPSPGRVTFEWQGQSFSLQPTGSEDELFFVFADRTSGKESYGASRFLYAKVENEQVVLDFNRAYNPPCAFTAFATCPLPTPENRLNVAVRAGEKKYAGSAH